VVRGTGFSDEANFRTFPLNPADLFLRFVLTQDEKIVDSSEAQFQSIKELVDILDLLLNEI